MEVERTLVVMHLVRFRILIQEYLSPWTAITECHCVLPWPRDPADILSKLVAEEDGIVSLSMYYRKAQVTSADIAKSLQIISR